MNQDYYVYECYNIDNGYIYYVGKGKGRRYKDYWKRNKEWKEYNKNNNCDVRIIKYFGNNEKNAYEFEKERILELKKQNQCCANIDDGGRRGGSAKGERNYQYGISPKERMREDVYNKWIEHLQDCNGIKNNNYGNHKLSEKYKNNPSLSIEKQSRKGSKNGMARPIELYDNNMNLIKNFDYIGECCQYFIENNLTESKSINNVRILISNSIKKNKPYIKYYFKYKKII